MIPNIVASHDTFDPYGQNYSSALPLQGTSQPPLAHPPTIDPRLLVYGSNIPSPHNNAPRTPLCTSQGAYYQHHSPGPSTSTPAGVWMGYQGDELPASVPSSITPGNSVSSYAIHMDRCICGCDRGPCIPQRDYDRQRTDPLNDDDLQEMILFRVGRKCGYPLSNAREKVYTNLDGRDDKVFIGFKSSISIRVEWLPYEKWTRQIRTLTWKKPPDNISRAKLATEVAKRMDIFFKEMLDKAADPSYFQYRGQPGVIDTDHLELVALKRVAKSSYMPHFRLITPQPQKQ